ncbi:MAG: hypothetical protein IKW06_01085 [Clostridia bacterium]|nr:hypothetical protein [Clostridia bacterium]
MLKADKTVIKETKYIAVCILILSALMQAVFLILSRWDYRVLLGNLLTGSAMIINFFFMGLAVQKAVMLDEKDARKTMQNSQTLRMLFVTVVVIIGVTVPYFSVISVIIPLFFPRIGIMFRPLWKDKEKPGQEV